MAGRSPWVGRWPSAQALGGVYWIGPDDFLFFTMIDSGTSATSVLATGHLLTEAGALIRFSVGPLALDGSRTSRLSNAVQLGAGGHVVDLSFTLVGTGIKRGQAYVQFLSGSGREGPVIGTLAQGYVYSNHVVALGDNVEPGPGGGEGNIRSIDLGNPAAGADYASQTVPTNAMWRPIAWVGTLVTDATAASRQPRVDITDGTDVVGALTVAYQFQTASLTHLYRATRDVGIGTRLDLNIGGTSGQFPASGAHPLPVADILLPEAYVLDWATVGIQLTDDWGDGQLLVEEWLVI